MKKVLSISLLFVFLLSTANMNIIRHFCGGRMAAVKLAVLDGNVSCGMDGEGASCKPSGFGCNNSEAISKKNCCENELTQISITDNYKPASNSELTNLQSLIVAFHTNFIFAHAQGHIIPVRSYKPPDYNSVSLPFIQVFLV